MSIEVMGGGGGIFPEYVYDSVGMSVNGNSSNVTSTSFSISSSVFERIRYIDKIQINGINTSSGVSIYFQCAFTMPLDFDITKIKSTVYGSNLTYTTYERASAGFSYDSSTKTLTISNIILGNSTSVYILSRTSDDIYSFGIKGHTPYKGW